MFRFLFHITKYNRTWLIVLSRANDLLIQITIRDCDALVYCGSIDRLWPLIFRYNILLKLRNSHFVLSVYIVILKMFTRGFILTLTCLRTCPKSYTFRFYIYINVFCRFFFFVKTSFILQYEDVLTFVYVGILIMFTPFSYFLGHKVVFDHKVNASVDVYIIRLIHTKNFNIFKDRNTVFLPFVRRSFRPLGGRTFRWERHSEVYWGKVVVPEED